MKIKKVVYILAICQIIFGLTACGNNAVSVSSSLNSSTDVPESDEETVETGRFRHINPGSYTIYLPYL